MPFIQYSDYQPPFLLRNQHLNTIYSGLIRRVYGVTYVRERINTPDDDFIDLDWSKKGSKKLLIVLHGLEGAADRPYVTGLIKHANEKGWDGVGMNFRSCSGEPNRALRVYHCGASDDLDVVVQHILQTTDYEQIALAGFSLGGNVVLKYTGERGTTISPKIQAAVGVSVPCDLMDARARFEKWDNRQYVRRFLTSLNEKIADKQIQYPDAVDYERLKKSKTVWEFDNIFTGPVHGYAGADDYYTKARSINFLPDVAIPTLLINAADDSFLGEKCFPTELAKKHPFFHLEIPKYGGHVGFVTTGNKGIYWTEQRILSFLENSIS